MGTSRVTLCPHLHPVFLIFPLGTDCPSWSAIQSYISIPTSEALDSAQHVGPRLLVPLARPHLKCNLGIDHFFLLTTVLTNILIRASGNDRYSPLYPEHVNMQRRCTQIGTRLQTPPGDLFFLQGATFCHTAVNWRGEGHMVFAAFSGKDAFTMECVHCPIDVDHMYGKAYCAFWRCFVRTQCP